MFYALGLLAAELSTPRKEQPMAQHRAKQAAPAVADDADLVDCFRDSPQLRQEFLDLTA